MEQQKKVVSINNFDDFWDKEDLQTIELQPINKPLQQTQIESTPTTITLPVDEDTAIDIIDVAVTIKYPTSLLNMFSTPLTERHFLDIITIISRHTDKLSDEFIDKLSAKNKQCANALEHFIALARKNVENVTIDTLQTIQSSNLEQPIAQLNQLPTQHIKADIMRQALKKTNHPYDIVLHGHTDTIAHFDICEITHRAATSSKDNTLRLWNLKTGQLVHRFPESKELIHCVQFNSDGSRLLTATNLLNKTCILKIWETESAQLHDIATIDMAVWKLESGTDNIFIACNYDNFGPRITVVSINNDRIKKVASTCLTYKKCLYTVDSKHWRHYEAKDPNSKTLMVTKKTCPPLYVCEQAIKNTPHISPEKSELLMKDPIYKSLTEYEEWIVIKALSAKQQQTNKLLTNK